jgi:hypothetical protein
MKRLQAGFVTAFFATGLGLFAIAPTTGCGAASQVNSVFMALDGEGNRPRDTFYPDTQTIFCDIDWVGRDPDTTVNAFIHQHKGEQVPARGASSGSSTSGRWVNRSAASRSRSSRSRGRSSPMRAA